MNSFRLLAAPLPEKRCLPAWKKTELLFDKEQDDTCGLAAKEQSDTGDSMRRTERILTGFRHI
jgi:hypothetical protein